MKYFCDECDARLWALDSQKCGVCHDCKEDCDVVDLEDMLEELMND
jgi:hypothetical protein